MTAMGGKAVVSTGRGNHPNGVWLYRVDHGGKSVVYATDTEHTKELDANVVQIASGADVLIYDSQYTPEEYEGTSGKGGSKVGWGHSTFAAAAEIAKAAKVKSSCSFTTTRSSATRPCARKRSERRSSSPNSIAAYEGLTIDV